jgi:hypothetical protein
MEEAIRRLNELGVDTNDLHQDYYKIPLENMDLSKVEREHPTKTKQISKHTIIIDSRQRDYSIYPTPDNYLINLVIPYKNVERIELVAVMLPKTEYNVTTENNLVLLTVNGLRQALYLTPGQYLIGSNQMGNISYKSTGDIPVFGLISELRRVLNTHQNSNNEFNVILATEPSPSDKSTPSTGTGFNASILNRIVITNLTNDFSIDFLASGYSSGSPYKLLGFLKQLYSSKKNSVAIYGNSDTGACTPQELIDGTVHIISISGLSSVYDYNMIDDPQYSIMNIEFGNRSAERIESVDDATDGKFAVIIYDANEPDNLSTYNSSTSDSLSLAYDRRPGRLKALKGMDFDKKILLFDPPIILDIIKIQFTKYDNTPYNFLNREHVLTFEMDIADYDPKYRA